jgi:hypothetical protein
MKEEGPVRLPGRGSNSITGLSVSSRCATAPLQALLDPLVIHSFGLAQVGQPANLPSRNRPKCGTVNAICPRSPE